MPGCQLGPPGGKRPPDELGSQALKCRPSTRTSACPGELPFLRCCLRRELMSDDLPTLGTPITMMQYSRFCRRKSRDQGPTQTPQTHTRPGQLNRKDSRCTGPAHPPAETRRTGGSPAGGTPHSWHWPTTNLSSVIAVAAPNQLRDHRDYLQGTDHRHFPGGTGHP